ncbi:hypothetical protein P692DRAFT_20832355 [Suillus brevipes Sb2]|nr:hypothetical protein P692DRAFT_20832355 [Suillus brevipes Sb2]
MDVQILLQISPTQISFSHTRFLKEGLDHSIPPLPLSTSSRTGRRIRVCGSRSGTST